MLKNGIIYLRGLASFFYLATFGLLSKKNRKLMSKVAEQVFGSSNDKKPIIASVPAVDVFDFIFDLELKGDFASAGDGNVSQLELKIISKLVQISKAMNIFEIGTFKGRTALAMAQNSSESTTVYTLDLPPQELDSAKLKLDSNDIKYVKKESSGSFFVGKPEGSKIKQLYGDSATFDFSPYYGKIDLLFIDGSHSYDYVVSDTKRTIDLISPNGGIILWHDYDTIYWEGVTRALNEFYLDGGKFAKLVNLKPTTLVCLVIGKS